MLLCWMLYVLFFLLHLRPSLAFSSQRIIAPQQILHYGTTPIASFRPGGIEKKSSNVSTYISTINNRHTSLSVLKQSQDNSVLAKVNSFDRVLDGLSESEKYNAVLQGLAGISLTSAGRERYNELLLLLDEMCERAISCSTRSSSMVLDAVTRTADVVEVSIALSKLRASNAVQYYARDLKRLSSLPSDPRKRSKVLEKLVPVPSDNRGDEMLHAGAFLSLVSFDLAGDSIAPALHIDSTIPALLTFATAAAVSFDLLKGGANRSRRILSGLNRLFIRDIDRESRTESAAFLVAYLCGLPCFAFKPNVIEALRMIESLPEMKNAVVAGNGTHRMLVWLLASVAGESLTHRQLIASDPRQASLFLKLAREKGLISREGEMDEINDENAIRWAFNEAREILKQNEKIFERLREAFEMERASAGECISIIENYHQ